MHTSSRPTFQDSSAWRIVRKRQQRIDRAVRAGAQCFQRIGQLKRWIEAVDLGGGEQGLDNGGAAVGAQGAGKQPVLLADGIGRISFSTGVLSIGRIPGWHSAAARSSV